MTRFESSFWHTVGRAAEAAISAIPSTGDKRGASKLAGLQKRSKRDTGSAVDDPLSGVLVAAASALAATATSRWARRLRPSMPRLIRGAAAGAGAAGVLLILRTVISRDDPFAGEPLREAADELLAGAGRGVVYAALLHRILPGPPLLRGALAGSADYFASPLGGIFSRLQPLSPVRRVPVISILLETGESDADPYLYFLLYGAVLGFLYGDDS